MQVDQVQSMHVPIVLLIEDGLAHVASEEHAYQAKQKFAQCDTILSQLVSFDLIDGTLYSQTW